MTVANSWKLKTNRPWKAAFRVTEFSRYHRKEKIQKYVNASHLYGWRSRFCCHVDNRSTAGGSCRNIRRRSRSIHLSQQYRIVGGIRQAFAKIRQFLQARNVWIIRAFCIQFACIHCPGIFDFRNAVLLKRLPKRKNQRSLSLETHISERLPKTQRDIDHLCQWMNYWKQEKSFRQ